MELAIRGGTVVDGTGGPARRADVGIAGGRINAVGPIRRVNGMPAYGERLIADAPSGIDHVLVASTPTRLDGQSLLADLETLPATTLRSV